jgi:hypothetical protein
MYTEMVGMDGKSGMKGAIKELEWDGREGRKKLHKKIEELEDKIVTKQECKTIREEPMEKRANVLKIRATEAGIIGGIITVVLAILKAVGVL